MYFFIGVQTLYLVIQSKGRHFSGKKKEQSKGRHMSPLINEQYSLQFCGTSNYDCFRIPVKFILFIEYESHEVYESRHTRSTPLLPPLIININIECQSLSTLLSYDGSHFLVCIFIECENYSHPNSSS